MTEMALKSFFNCVRQATPDDQRQLKRMWDAVGLPPLADDLLDKVGQDVESAS
jgi:hypothetical protein